MLADCEGSFGIQNYGGRRKRCYGGLNRRNRLAFQAYPFISFALLSMGSGFLWELFEASRIKRCQLPLDHPSNDLAELNWKEQKIENGDVEVRYFFLALSTTKNLLKSWRHFAI